MTVTANGLIRFESPIKDLISETSETGKVVHRKSKKTSVTFHGSGENLDHEGVLDAWRSRGISMQFAIDDVGDIAQYVVADEYACAVGPTQGCESSIHIELVNAKEGSAHEISDETLKSAARLVGWLFVYVINDHPARDNVFTHEHWSPITCLPSSVVAGFNLLIGEIQGWYVFYRNQQKEPTTFEVVDKDPEVVRQTRLIQKALGIRQTGVWAEDTDQAVMEFRRLHRRR